MINEREIRAEASKNNVDPMVSDLDYCLSWVLWGLGQTRPDFHGLVFKGGTCLRKCYFHGYRFSEDLDFTATGKIVLQQIEQWLNEMGEVISSHDGPDFNAQPISVKIVNDEYGKESFQGNVYFRGPLARSGHLRKVKFDITREEPIFLPVNRKGLIHPYSDADFFSTIQIPCYSLEEVMAEKIRAINGQRRFAISRDLYDIYNVAAAGVDIDAIRRILEDKFNCKGIILKWGSIEYLLGRKEELRLDWERKLSHLITGVTFDEVWDEAIEILGRILSSPD